MRSTTRRRRPRACPVVGAQPQHDRREDQLGPAAGCPLGVAGGQPAEPLEPVEAPLDHVAVGVTLRVERRRSPTTGAFRRAAGDLVGLLRAGEPDPAPAQRGPGAGVGVGIVGQDPARTRSGRSRGRPGPFRRTEIWSSSGSSCGLSPARPRVRMIDMGRPQPSTARWVLLVRPPQDRPRASPSTTRSSTQEVVVPPFPGPQPSAGGSGRRWSRC